MTRPRGLIVVMYHRINQGSSDFFGLQAELFRQQMQWLKANCQIIHPDEVEQQLLNPRRRKPPVLITFDDGFRDYHDNAYPILQELRIPALVFVATSFIDKGGMIWTDRVRLAAQRSTAKLQLPWVDNKTFDMSRADDKRAFESASKRYLKTVSDAQRQVLLQEVLDRLQVDLPAVEAEIGRQMLTWQEVRAVAEFTTIGGHSHTHPILSRLPNDEAADEIQICRDRIASEIGVQPRFFAYPNGGTADYTKQVQVSTQSAGFRLAYSTRTGINGPDEDRFALLRQPGDALTLGDFARLLSAAG